MLDALRETHFASPGWEVAGEVELQDEIGKRRADGLALHMGQGSLWFEGFELKKDKRDARNEIRNIAKSAPMMRSCRYVHLVLLGTWKSYFDTLDSVPEPWGVFTVDGSRVEQVRKPQEREDYHEPTPILVRSFVSALARRVKREASPTFGCPTKAVVRALRGRVVLQCRHRVICQSKVAPTYVPCFSCLAGDPPERDAVLDAIADGTADDRRAYLSALGVDPDTMGRCA